MQEMWVWSLDGEDPLEKEMASYSSILAWRIPWTEEPGELYSMGYKEMDMTNTFTFLGRQAEDTFHLLHPLSVF